MTTIWKGLQLTRGSGRDSVPEARGLPASVGSAGTWGCTEQGGQLHIPELLLGASLGSEAEPHMPGWSDFQISFSLYKASVLDHEPWTLRRSFDERWDRWVGVCEPPEVVGSYCVSRAMCVFWGEGLKEGAENLRKS